MKSIFLKNNIPNRRFLVLEKTLKTHQFSIFQSMPFADGLADYIESLFPNANDTIGTLVESSISADSSF